MISYDYSWFVPNTLFLNGGKGLTPHIWDMCPNTNPNNQSSTNI